MAKAIKAEGLSKAYQLGDFGTGTISRDLERFWARVRGKEDPFLKIGEINDRTSTSGSDIVWSLKDIGFEIEQGDAVGIIGRNGAGKSTLLKILSRVTSPTSGSVKVKGRIASLLEVGTGFHPELTGKENIFLNGAILGMRKAEIKRKFDEIVAFAGVERYIDTPVKRYSSGMYVRLAFAVAAHLESEILIVDEVLAVGDAEFQKKCLGKMGEVSKGEGRTVLFVSHNMGSIQSLCNKGMLLHNGQMAMFDDTPRVISEYINKEVSIAKANFEAKTALPMSVLSVSIYNSDGQNNSQLSLEAKFSIGVTYQVFAPVGNMVCAMGITTQSIPVTTTWSPPADLEPGIYTSVFYSESLHLAIGTYSISIGLSIGKNNVQYISDALKFKIEILDKIPDPNVISYEGSTGLITNPMRVITTKANDIIV